MAHKKGMGSTRNGRDSNGQRLGVKKYGGETVLTGNIIVRQHGSHIHAGRNVGIGKDDTLFALAPGTVRFETFRKAGLTRKRVLVDVSAEAATAEVGAAETATAQVAAE